jgi:hypothetical protein
MMAPVGVASPGRDPGPDSSQEDTITQRYQSNAANWPPLSLCCSSSNQVWPRNWKGVDPVHFRHLGLEGEVGEVFMECSEKTRLPDYGFLWQRNNRALRGRRRRPEEECNSARRIKGRRPGIYYDRAGVQNGNPGSVLGGVYTEQDPEVVRRKNSELPE